MRSGGNGLATFAEKIKQSDESIPSSGMPAVASGASLMSDLFGGNFARDGSSPRSWNARHVAHFGPWCPQS
jgi:hypothetical protein